MDAGDGGREIEVEVICLVEFNQSGIAGDVQNAERLAKTYCSRRLTSESKRNL